MVFKVLFEGESVVCSSPRCIQLLLHQGWRLADPAQTEHLLEALEAEEWETEGELDNNDTNCRSGLNVVLAATYSPRTPWNPVRSRQCPVCQLASRPERDAMRRSRS